MLLSSNQCFIPNPFKSCPQEWATTKFGSTSPCFFQRRRSIQTTPLTIQGRFLEMCCTRCVRTARSAHTLWAGTHVTLLLAISQKHKNKAIVHFGAETASLPSGALSQFQSPTLSLRGMRYFLIDISRSIIQSWYTSQCWFVLRFLVEQCKGIDTIIFFFLLRSLQFVLWQFSWPAPLEGAFQAKNGWLPQIRDTPQVHLWRKA